MASTDPTPDLGAITPEDLEIARQAARAVKAFTRIYEVASLFAEIVTRLDTRQRELAALDLEQAEKRVTLGALNTDIERLTQEKARETTALAQLRERSATAETDASNALMDLTREHTTAMEKATREHKAALAELDRQQRARAKALDAEYDTARQVAEEALAVIQGKLTRAEEEARQTAERLVGS